MYEKYFGFRQAPFGVTPDPRFLYRNDRYEEALSTLLYGIRARKGFVMLTGEVGTGKTTLLHAAIAELAGTPFVFVFNAVADFDQLLTIICDELELAPLRADRPARLAALNRFLTEQLKTGSTTVLLIDEAQNLSPQTLEDLRLLSNLETPPEKLLQIVLVGQPELAARLADPSLRQLRQRIVLRYQLKALPAREVADFVRHRLLVAGAADDSVIAPDAVSQIARLSGGIPRLVNMICDNALLVCYGSSQQTVTTAIVNEVAMDLGLTEPSTQPAESLGDALLDVERFAARAHPSRERILTTPLLIAGMTTLVLFSGIAAAISSREPGSLTGPLIERWRRASYEAPSAVAAPLRLPAPLQPAAPLQSPEAAKSPEPEIALPPPPPTPIPAALVVAKPDASAAAAPARQDAAKATMERPRARAAATAPPLEPLVATAKQITAPPAKDPVQRASSTEYLLAPESGPPHLATGARVLIPIGSSLLQIVDSAYGDYCRVALDLLPPSNPGLRNYDGLLPGQTITLPPLDMARLLRAESDGSSRLVVGAYFTRELATRVASAFSRRSGLRVETTMRPLSASLTLYRVDVTGLRSSGDIARAWSQALEMDLVPSHLEPFSRSLAGSGLCQDPSERAEAKDRR